MELPAVFEADIQSRTLSIVTRVVMGEDNPIYLSTHSMTFEANYYKPLLLDIPSMKESVDYENRNFKISNVSLKISNYEYNGETFSDSLKDNPLINEKCNIYWNTQSANSSEDTLRVFKGYVRRVSHTDSEVSIQLEDLTENKLHKKVPSKRTSYSLALDEKYRDAPIPIAFGVLNNAPAVLDVGYTIKADSNESIELISEDSEHYQSHHVWGDFSEYNEDGAYSPVRYLDGQMLYIPKTPNVKIEHDSDDEIGVFRTPQSHVQYYDQLDQNTPVTQSGTVILSPFDNRYNGVIVNLFQIYTSGKSSKINCHHRSDNSIINLNGMTQSDEGTYGYDTPQRFGNAVTEYLSDDDYSFESMESLNSGILLEDYQFNYADTFDYEFWSSTANSAQGLFKITIASEPRFSYESMRTQWATDQKVHLAINGHPILILNDTIQDAWYNRIVQIFSRTQTASNAQALYDGAIFPKSSGDKVYLDGLRINANGSSGESIGQNYKNVFQFLIDGQPDSDAGYRGYDTVQDNMISTIDVRRTDGGLDYGGFIAIADATLEYGEYHIYIGDYVAAGYALVELEGAIGGDWAEIDLLHIADVEFSKSADYYLSVTGRREEGTLLRNPIEIMKNIAVDELGLDPDSQIDDESYQRAKAIHNDLKFDFSVKDEIKSKDLFESIAKSTLCYPYFNNQGKFAFASYKSSYTTDDFENAKVIKDNDVINFSFNKTKHEQTYTSVKFKYNYDYTSEKYHSFFHLNTSFGSALSPHQEVLDYNGYTSWEDNVLEFESPYIKDKETAEKVWAYMYRDHQYQHLTCKLKLPLHYIHLDVGDTIKFDKLLGGLKAFGIDYTKMSNFLEFSFYVDGWRRDTALYPMFFVTSVNKNLDSIEIEARQIHHLDSSAILISDWDYEYPEQPEDEDDDIVIPPDLSDEFLIGEMSGFKTVHEPLTLSNIDLFHWSQPEAFGLESFNSLIPTDFSYTNGSGIYNYQALVFHINVSDNTNPSPFIMVLRLKNISNSGEPEQFEFGWTQEILVEGGGGVYSPEEIDSTATFPFFAENANAQEPDWYIIDSNATTQTTHTLGIGEGLLRAIEWVPEMSSILEGLTFYAGVDIIMSGAEGYGLGDPNNDGTVNILDVVLIVNSILTSLEFDAVEYASADANNDGTVNILDIVVIVQHILGEGGALG